MINVKLKFLKLNHKDKGWNKGRAFWGSQYPQDMF